MSKRKIPGISFIAALVLLTASCSAPVAVQDERDLIVVTGWRDKELVIVDLQRALDPKTPAPTTS